MPEPRRPESPDIRLRNHDSSNDWGSIGEAARRLGVSRQAIQARIRRGTLETRVEVVGNRQQVRVRLPQPSPQPAAQEVTQEPMQPAAQGAELAETKAALVRWQERTKQLGERLAEAQAREQRLLALIERLSERRGIWAELREWLARRLRS